MSLGHHPIYPSYFPHNKQLFAFHQDSVGKSCETNEFWPILL